MQKMFLWLFCFALLVGGSFAAGRAWDEKKRSSLAAGDFLDNGFSPSPFPLQQRSFVVFICGYNNGAFVEKTLRSVFSQAYDAYRVIYIDDASEDGSFEAATDCMYLSGQMLRVNAVRNEERLGQLANLSRAAQACRDDEILVVLNGEDWLAHEWVLSSLNQYYADPDLWLTYGQYCEFPSYQRGEARQICKSEWDDLRRSPFAAGHLKTFYAGLFRKIAPDQLMHHGSFFSAAFELAIMLPMLEMAKEHFQFLSETLYVFNRNAPVQIDPEAEAFSEKIVRSFKPCEPLASLSLCEGDRA